MLITSIPMLYCVGLLLGLVAGFVMHRSDYCVAAMFRDLFLFRTAAMLRILLWQIVVTMVFFELARRLGWLSFYPFPLLGSPSLANVAGGFLFGIGMVLAGGCVVGTLYKMGAGSVASGLAFVGLILGSGLYAEFHPWWGAFSKATTFLKGTITLPQALGVSPTLAIGCVVLVALWLLQKWYRQGLLVRPAHAAGYLQPWKTALVLAGIGLLSYLFMGMPMGITTTYSKLAAMAETVVAPAHVARVGYFQLVPLKVTEPVSGAVLQGGPGAGIDFLWAIQFPLIVGIVLGSMLSALLLREFTLHFRVPAGQLAMAFGGGILLGLASRMVPSCNVWHLMGGLPILALPSIFFLVGLVPGAWAGSRMVSYVILRQSGRAPGGEHV